MHVPHTAAVAVVHRSLASSDPDPYLQYQPHFALSLPVQILLNGVITTLVAVLLIHLLFTAQYHWPLARLNYALQLSGVITLLASLCATIVVVLYSVHRNSQGWPYMLDYIAVPIPPQSWSTTERALWYSMEALTSGLAHMTNIQFLTLLYPSKIEARLIFLLLGPLAIASSAMTFTSLSDYKRASDLGDAIRGVCNTTLSLLFSISLFVWGFAVNRHRAWRTDGGTAVFGAGACILTIISAVVNFILIFEDGIIWMPYLLWAVVLWQSFLGWWWWVGSGMGIGEVEEMLHKEQKRRDARRRKRARKGIPITARGSVPGKQPNDVSSNTSRLMSTIVPSALSRRRHPSSNRSSGSGQDRGVHVELEVTSFSGQPTNLSASDSHSLDSASTTTNPPTSSTPVSSSSTPLMGSFLRNVPFAARIHASALRAFRSIRKAHTRAAEAQALEVSAAELAMANGGGATEGWGLGNFGLREREEAERRIQMFHEERRRRALLTSGDEEGGEDEGEGSDDGESIDLEARRELDPQRPPGSHLPSTDPGPPRSRLKIRTSPLPRELVRSPGPSDPLPPVGSVFWWWGPLRRWRLQDRTVYS